MEPINYRDALRRRWPLIPALALVGAIVGALIPVHVPSPPPRTQYEATALAGVTPGGSSGPNSIGSNISVSQIVFFAANQQIIVNAANSAHIKGTPSALEKDIVISSARKRKKSLTPAGTIQVTVKQPSAKRSAKLTNAFIVALNDYINQRLASQHNKAIRTGEQKVSNLSTELANIEQQILALTPPPTTTTTTPTTTTTVPKTKTTTAPKVASSSAAAPTTTTTTTTTTAPTTTTSAVGASARLAPAVLTASKSNPDLAQLQEQAAVYRAAYQEALSNLTSLKQNPVPTSGFFVLQPALAKNAKKIPAHVSVLDHHSIRALLGLLAGAVVGVGLVLLLDALDKRLRSVARTQETLGFPVLAEIPEMMARSRLGWPGGRASSPLPSPFAVFSEPTSTEAEAYRMLRTAILLQPIMGPGPPAAPGEHRPRDVILVVSAGAEPTRALVVTNLAAAFAEAGHEAIIVTTADLRRHDNLTGTMVMASVEADMSPATVAAATRPTEIPGVRSLALGRLLDGPGHLAPIAPGILASARQVADVVIVDAPLLAVHDAEALVPAVDVVVVVVQSWWTRVDQATRSGAFLRRISAPVVGAALTEVHFGHKDLRRLSDQTAPMGAENDEDEMMGASRMSQHGRRRGRRSRWAGA